MRAGHAHEGPERGAAPPARELLAQDHAHPQYPCPPLCSARRYDCAHRLLRVDKGREIRDGFSQETWLIHIGVGVGGGGAAVTNTIRTCGDILVYLLGGKGRRIVMLADAGAGKSWMMQQLMYLCAQHCDGGDRDMAEWAPIFIPVQAIASFERTGVPEASPRDADHRVGNRPRCCAKPWRMSERCSCSMGWIRQVWRARWWRISSWRWRVSSSHRIMVTSRPEGAPARGLCQPEGGSSLALVCVYPRTYSPLPVL